MRTSDETNELAKALAAAQAVMTNPPKDTENPHFKSRYATLDGGLNIIRPALSANGIAFLQTTRMEGDVMMLDTRLIHASGQWVEFEYPVARFPARQQELGSSISYARRYSLFSAVGVAGELDDDGNAATEKTPAPQKASKSHEPSAVAKAIKWAFEQADTVEAIDAAWRMNNEATKNCGEFDYAWLKEEFKRLKAALKESGKGTDDGI